MNLYEELTWRGLVNDITSKDLIKQLNEGSLTFYIGTDPTGDSMHIGHFSSLLCAKRLKDHGHTPIMLVGGATGFIGDPKATGERSMLSEQQLEHNFNALNKQISEVFGFEMVNNLDWTKDISIISFLREYGKFFNVNYMLSKDTVKSRLDSGISYTEFSYMILQSLDYLHLYQEKNCRLQIGGQDQWGNITAGLELIRKKHGTNVQCFGMTMPLITKADGTKFGKSEGGNVYLDKTKTSPYEMYQFLVNSEDSKVMDYLKKLTLLNKQDIEVLESSLNEEPYKRIAQKRLAQEVVCFLHGVEEYEKALRMSNALFQGDLSSLSKEELISVVDALKPMEVSDNLGILDVLVDSKIAPSKREARAWIAANTIQVNGEVVKDQNFMLSSKHAIHGAKSILKKGKRNYYIIVQR